MKSVLKKFITCLLILFYASINMQVWAQSKAYISGTVIDKETGETIPGATVKVIETAQVGVTDLDGKYKITIQNPGEYTIVISFLSYQALEFAKVKVSAGDITSLNASMISDSKSLKEVVVEGEARRESLQALLIQQKNSLSVSDGISAENIRKTPDRNSSDVLKRISGTSIQDNKFAIVRGLNERYNAAYVNGAPLPSSESDRKAFSFDIFPASLLDNITIIKSGSADLPADFAGGIIQINTRSIPEVNTQQLSVSTGYNSLATFKPYADYNGGKYDWLGMDDGTRKMPDNLPVTADFRKLTSADMAEQAKNMTSDWSVNQKSSAPLNGGFQYALGQTFKAGKTEFGAVLALTYNNSNSTRISVRKEFQEPFEDEEPLQEFELNDTEYINQVNSAALVNVSAKINGRHVISLKNMASLNAEDKVTERFAIRDYSADTPIFQKGTVLSYTQNRLISNQLNGEHLITKNGLKVKYLLSVSDVERDIPNLRRMIYQKSDESDSIPYTANIAASGVSVNNGGNMFFSHTGEKIYSGGTDLIVPLTFLPFKSEIKAGVWYQEREREFTARNFSYTRYSRGSRVKFKDSLLYLPIDQIFAAENMGEISPYVPSSPGKPAVKGVGGFKLEEGTKLNDSYTAGSINKAGYVMYDVRPFKKWHLVMGARAEEFRQFLNTFEDDGDSIGVDTTMLNILPSGTLIYSPGEKTNIRFSYAKTLSRPEFREMAPFGFYDFVTDFTVRGNPELAAAQVHNFDLKYELYPGMAQLFSVAVFYKQFTNAIEQVNRADVSRELYYQNVKRADNFGAEIEYRVNVGWAFDKPDNKWLTAINLYSNIAIINSTVDVSDVQGARLNERPLQGQSPYLFNCGLQFTDPITQCMLNVNANKVGRRIAIVGNINEPDIWENPRTVIDLQLSRTFFKRLEVKVAARDILANNLVYYQDLNNNGKFDLSSDNDMSVTRFAPTYTASLGFRIQ